jgi:hypothetical protein
MIGIEYIAGYVAAGIVFEALVYLWHRMKRPLPD